MRFWLTYRRPDCLPGGSALPAWFFLGTFARARRASAKPIAIACSRLLTTLPEPLFNVPAFILCIARSTLPPGAFFFAVIKRSSPISTDDDSLCVWDTHYGLTDFPRVSGEFNPGYLCSQSRLTVRWDPQTCCNEGFSDTLTAAATAAARRINALQWVP